MVLIIGKHPGLERGLHNKRRRAKVSAGSEPSTFPLGDRGSC